MKQCFVLTAVRPSSLSAQACREWTRWFVRFLPSTLEYGTRYRTRYRYRTWYGRYWWWMQSWWMIFKYVPVPYTCTVLYRKKSPFLKCMHSTVCRQLTPCLLHAFKPDLIFLSKQVREWVTISDNGNMRKSRPVVTFAYFQQKITSKTDSPFSISFLRDSSLPSTACNHRSLTLKFPSFILKFNFGLLAMQ